MVVPFLVGALQNIMYSLPFIIAGVVTSLATLLGSRLPETKDRPTREVYEDFFERDPPRGENRDVVELQTNTLCT